MSLIILSHIAVLLSCLSLALTQQITGPSSGALINSKYQLWNITQPLYHDGTGPGTFSQRFQLVTDFYKPGGPIMLTLGTESGMPPVENGQFFDIAEELGGAVAVLEHRFFGTSLPEGLNGSLGSYAPLTLDNVMEDAVAFMKYAKKNISGAANSEVFVYGGSYGGNLAISMRVKHPEVFYGAFASGAATESWGPSPDDSVKFNLAIEMSNIYFDESLEAASKIQAAMSQFESCVIGKNCSEALPELNLCGTTPNATDFAKLYSVTQTNYRYIPMFNYPVASVYSMPYPFQYLMNATLSASSAGEVLRIPLAMVNYQEDLSKCVEWTSANISGGIDVAISQSYDYLSCQYYPIQELAVPPGNIMPAYAVTGSIPICPTQEFRSAMFNQSNGEWQNYLSTDTATLDNTTRLVIFQGGYDRVAGIGMPSLTLSDNREHSRVIHTRGLGHGGDNFPKGIVPRGVQAELDLIRDTKLEIIRSWLHPYNASTAFNSSTSFDLDKNRHIMGNRTNDSDHNDDDRSSKEKAKKIAIIVGSVVAGLIVLGSITALVLLCCCLRRRQAQRGRIVPPPGIPSRGWTKVDSSEGYEMYREGLLHRQDNEPYHVGA